VGVATVHHNSNREDTMFTFIIIPTILVLVAVSLIFRLLVRPVLNPYRIRRPYFGPYGYYGRGYRPHRFGWFLPVLVLVALDRIFGRRW
jgi:hypothetical protein